MSRKDNGRPDSWSAAFIEIHDRNIRRGEGPTTWRGLARRMAIEASGDPEHQPTHQEVERYRRDIKRYIKGEREPNEATRELIARAALVSVADLPKSLSRGSLRERYEEQRERNRQLEDEVRQLREELAESRRRREGPP